MYAKIYPFAEAVTNKKLIADITKFTLPKKREMGAAASPVKQLRTVFNPDNKSNEAIVAVYNDSDEVVGWNVLRRVGGMNPTAYSTVAMNYRSHNMLNYSSAEHPMVVAFNAMAKYMFKNSVYQLYAIQADRPAYRKLSKANQTVFRYASEWYDEEKQQYKWHCTFEGRVPAGEEHPNPAIQKSVIGRVYSMPVTVRCHTLKNEYRPGWDEVSDWWMSDNK